jgi:MFS transporter, FSR family, fosmidomycin resistance protein
MKNNQENDGPYILEKPGIIEQWGGKSALFFTYTHLSHDLTTGLLAALLPFIRQDLKLDYLQAGFLVSANALASGFAQFLGGWLSDRMGPRKAISLGLAGVGISSAAIIFTHSYSLLVVVFIIMGILAGLYHPSAVSTLTNRFEDKKRGRVIALHMLGGGLGFAIGPFFGAIISSYLNWHFAFLFLGIPAIVASVLAFFQLKLEPTAAQLSEVAASYETKQKPVTIWQVFKSAAGIMALSIAMALITGPVMSFIPLFLVDVHHLSESAGSMWVTVIRLAGLAGSLFGGWLADRWGRRNAIFLSLVLFGPVVFLLARLPFGFALAVVFVLFGWLLSMRETTMQTYLMVNTPPKIRATVFGIYFGFGQQGSSIVQPIAGNYMDTYGITGVYNVISYITLGFSLLALVVALEIGKRIKRKPLKIFPG